MSLASRLLQRDLDAFRAGITEQVRREVETERTQADIDRNLKKRGVDRVKLVRGDELKVGDTTVDTRGIFSYCADWDIVDISTKSAPNGEPLRPGTIWVSYASKFGSGGQVIYPDSQILVEDRS